MRQMGTAIRSLLVPLERERLLLPGSVVAEVAPYSELAPAPPGSPDWFAGVLRWRGQQLPVVSVESFLGDTTASVGERARIVVLKALGSGLAFYGIVARQIPQLMSVESGMLDAVGGTETPLRPGVAAEAAINGQALVIPDLDAIEAALCSTWRAGAGG